MGELRVAQGFVRRVAMYAEQHAIGPAAPTSEATGSGDSKIGLSQGGVSTVLSTIKLQVRASVGWVALGTHSLQYRSLYAAPLSVSELTPSQCGVRHVLLQLKKAQSSKRSTHLNNSRLQKQQPCSLC